MTRILLAFVVAPLLFAAPAAPQDAPADPFAGVPDVEFIYYDVQGGDAKAIRKDMNAKRFVDRNDGKPVDSLSSWRYGWRMRRGPDGRCDPASVELRFTAEVKLPRLANAETLPARVRKRWQDYYAALLRHEAGHVGYAWSQHGVLLAALKASSCETMAATGKAELDKIRGHDRAYDAETRHGATQGAIFP